jgi:hypothetical protein
MEQIFRLRFPIARVCCISHATASMQIHNELRKAASFSGRYWDPAVRIRVKQTCSCELTTCANLEAQRSSACRKPACRPDSVSPPCASEDGVTVGGGHLFDVGSVRAPKV